MAQDYVYAIKRFYDPQYNSSDLYLFETVQILGLSEVRRAAIEARKPFDYDREVEGLRALDRYTVRWRARWWSTMARTSATTRWAPAPSG